jgi:hypothetical protein
MNDIDLENEVVFVNFGNKSDVIHNNSGQVELTFL